MIAIGIFSITLSDERIGVSKAYVDWLDHAAGVDTIKIVLIPQTCSLPTLRRYLQSLHGLIIPGGNDDIHHPSSAYYQRIQYALTYAREHSMPVFGICAGFMAMVSYELGTWPLHVKVYDILSRAGSQHLTLKGRRFFKTMGCKDDLLEAQNALAYNHHYGVDAQVFKKHPYIQVYSVAPQGYAALLHWRDLPWLATQYHPEKPQWERSPKQTIPRTKEALAIGNVMADYFLSLAKAYADRTKVVFKHINNHKNNWSLKKTPTSSLVQFDMPSYMYIYMSST